MPTISRELLETGMVLADSVLNPRGQVLIPTGTAIEDKHLRGLKTWGIKSVNVTPSTAPEMDIQSSESESRLSNDEMEGFINDFVHHNAQKLDHPLIKEVKSLATERLAKHGISPSVRKGLESVPAPEDGATRRPDITVDELIEMTSGIATLPNIYLELQNILSRPLSASTDMAEAIRNDPGLTVRLLRIVNSAYYSFPSKIETVPRAITIVGTDELTSLITATSVLSTFGAGLDNLINMNLFWKHSISCGVIARILGTRRNEQNVERFFVMGLLHDIGKLIMFSHIPKVAKTTMQRSRMERSPLHVMESEFLGFNHAAVGSALARTWRMAASQQEAIAYHHKPSLAMRYPIEASLTHVADILAHVLCIGQSSSIAAPPLESEAFERLALDASIIGSVLADADDQVGELIDIFFNE
jgi:HD-like signal output (HDOD) protein